jgi:hypothetical protein
MDITTASDRTGKVYYLWAFFDRRILFPEGITGRKTIFAATCPFGVLDRSLVLGWGIFIFHTGLICLLSWGFAAAKMMLP